MFVVLLPLLVILPSGEESWPSFLGPAPEGLQASHLPLTWTASEDTGWMAEIPGHGQSSPVVWGDKLFVTSVVGPQKDFYHVSCFNRHEGTQLWSHRIENSHPVANSYYVSRAAPTPVVDASRCVAFFESGDCVAFSHDGQVLWQRDLAQEVGEIEAEFGLGASPCQTDQSVFILIEHDGPGCLLALDKETGDLQWKAERKPARSWSSPAIVHVEGVPQVVVSSGGGVVGYEPSSGNELWTLEDIGGNTGCTPIDCGEGRFLVGASPGRNGENAGSAARSNCLVKVSRAGDGFAAEKLWIAEGVFPSWASPILHRGLAYWINRAGVVFCFDAKTGEEVYAERAKQACWATPLPVGDRIYLFGKDGLVSVIKAGPEFEVLAEGMAWEPDRLPAESPLPEETTEERRRASAMFSKPTLYGYAATPDAIYLRVGNAVMCRRQ